MYRPSPPPPEILGGGGYIPPPPSPPGSTPMLPRFAWDGETEFRQGLRVENGTTNRLLFIII